MVTRDTREITDHGWLFTPSFISINPKHSREKNYSKEAEVEIGLSLTLIKQQDSYQSKTHGSSNLPHATKGQIQS